MLPVLKQVFQGKMFVDTYLSPFIGHGDRPSFAQTHGASETFAQQEWILLHSAPFRLKREYLWPQPIVLTASTRQLRKPMAFCIGTDSGTSHAAESVACLAMLFYMKYQAERQSHCGTGVR